MPLTLKNFYKQGGGGWQPGANTVAYYPLNGDVDDYSGNNVTLTVLGATSAVGTPVFDTVLGDKKCGYFTGNGAYASNWFAYRTTTGIPSSGNMTVSFWFNVGALPSGYSEIVDCRDASGFYRMAMLNSSGKYLFHGSAQEVTNFTPTIGTWYNIINVVDSGTCKIYLNGNTTPIYTDSYSYGDGSVTYFNVGGTCNPSAAQNYRNETYNGKLADIIIEDKARTAQEILDYFNLTKSLYGIS